jgi:class 3 adenylate cyclase
VDRDRVLIGDHSIPGDVRNGALVNFEPGYPIPTFSLADMFACVMAGRGEFLKKHFGNKVVLLGAVLDVEDRKLTSRRFIVEPEGPYSTERCALPSEPITQEQRFVRRNIPGVYVHAQAINDIIRAESLQPVGRLPATLIGVMAAVGAGFVAFSLPPAATSLVILAGSAVWAAIATTAFNRGMVLPLIDPMLAASLAAVLLIAYRIIITDKARRRLQRAFGFYLPASLIDRMIETETLPALGGEEREITVWFSDLVGFTLASERQTAQEVVSRLNRYFSAMVENIEAHGGYVDKFIGDGIVALFGAPVLQPDSAAAALSAARACQRKLNDMAPNGEFKTRIGLHTGLAVIGNIGSPQRFNYTAMGDTVNVAARLESANKGFGTSVLLSEATWIRAGKPSLVRKIGRIRVTGRVEPLTVYALPPEGTRAAAFERFEMALELAEKRKFAESLEIFSELESADHAAALWADCLRSHMKEPSPAQGELVVELREK